MTITTKVLVASKLLETVQTTQYTATNVKAIIDKCTVFNGTPFTVTLAINVVNGGGVAGISNLFISTTLQPGEETECAEIIGHVLENGDSVSAFAGTATSLTFRMSGREIS